MKTEITDTNDTRKTVAVTFSPEEVAEQEKELLESFRKNAKIPGFRPGKAPDKMIRARFAKDMKEELRKRLVSKAHQDAVVDAEFDVFRTVDLEEGEIREGEEVRISFEVDIVPPFEVPEYEGLTVRVEPSEASDQEVDDILQRILNQRAEYKVAEKAAEKGDYVRCSYEGKIGEEKIEDLVPDAPIFGTQKSTWEEAGAEQAPGVRAVVDGVVGMKAGDSKEVSMTFPDDFKPEALAGKTAVYNLEVEEVREKELPEMDEAFFESLQVKDEAELRDRLRENIENQKKQRNSGAEREQITQHLVEAADFPVPQSGVEEETESILREYIQQNIQQGVSQEDLEQNKEALHAGAAQAAEGRLKSRLILAKIAEKEGIEATNEDLSQMVMNQAMQAGQKPDQLVKELRKDRQRVQQMQNQIVLGKTMDLLLEKANREPVEQAPENAGAET
ncbi:MAG: trigger factor [Opitutales bacterium]